MSGIAISPQLLVAAIPREPHEPFLDHGKTTHIVIACLELRASRARLEQAGRTVLRLAHETRRTIAECGMVTYDGTA
jgi:hypothetical protein